MDSEAEQSSAKIDRRVLPLAAAHGFRMLNAAS